MRAISRLRRPGSASDRPSRTARSHPLPAAKDGFEAGDAGARHGDADFDHAPQIDEDALLKRVGSLGEPVDGVQADNAADGGKGAGAKNEVEDYPIAAGALDAAEGWDGEDKDPNVCYYVESGCRCGQVVSATPGISGRVSW